MKRMLLIAAVLALIFVAALPAFAQPTVDTVNSDESFTIAYQIDLGAVNFHADPPCPPGGHTGTVGCS